MLIQVSQNVAFGWSPTVIEWLEWQRWREGETDQGRLERMGVAIRIDEDEMAGPEGLDTPVLF
ncbi:MAG TPA: hypothetical protein VK860_05035, partial [Ilumatobacteraceae bacterium]|nr:hypothetical protein [Ilumatobacteraceae bacterium]